MDWQPGTSAVSPVLLIANVVENAFWRSIRLKNQMEAVIRDLDKDVTTEMATGVSHLNFAMEQIKGELRPPKHGMHIIES